MQIHGIETIILHCIKYAHHFQVISLSIIASAIIVGMAKVEDSLLPPNNIAGNIELSGSAIV